MVVTGIDTDPQHAPSVTNKENVYPARGGGL